MCIYLSVNGSMITIMKFLTIYGLCCKFKSSVIDCAYFMPSLVCLVEYIHNLTKLCILVQNDVLY